MIRRIIAALAAVVALWLRPRHARLDVFEFHDGTRRRRADPLAAYVALRSHPEFDWTRHPTIAGEELTDANGKDFSSLRTTVAAVRGVFAVPAFEAGGLTDFDCLGLLERFETYCDGVKKNASPTPISPPPTASPSSDAPPPTGSASSAST